MTNAKGHKHKMPRIRVRCGLFEFLVSAFGILSSFEFRHSTFSAISGLWRLTPE
jgi:hypothetical protein